MGPFNLKPVRAIVEDSEEGTFYVHLVCTLGGNRRVDFYAWTHFANTWREGGLDTAQILIDAKPGYWDELETLCGDRAFEKGMCESWQMIDEAMAFYESDARETRHPSLTDRERNPTL